MQGMGGAAGLPGRRGRDSALGSPEAFLFALPQFPPLPLPPCLAGLSRADAQNLCVQAPVDMAPKDTLEESFAEDLLNNLTEH